MMKRDRQLHAVFYEKWNPFRIDSVRTSDGCQIHFKLYRFANNSQGDSLTPPYHTLLSLELNEIDLIRVMMIPGKIQVFLEILEGGWCRNCD